MLESYVKTMNIEALTMLEMAKQDIIPASIRWSGELAEILSKKSSVLPIVSCKADEALLGKVSSLSGEIYTLTEKLSEALSGAADITDEAELAMYYRTVVLPAMDALRASADELETITPPDIWPFPSYGTILFRV